jgi:hypothetical protein
MKSGFAGLVAAALVLAACASPAPAARGGEEAFGVRIEGLRLSAAGYMLDLRYRVLDVEKARPFFDRESRPILMEEGTGARLVVPSAPKVGQLRTTGARNAVADRSYSILFANPGRYAEAGAKLTLVVGELRIPGLVVE